MRDEYFLNGPEDYRLMSQTGVRQYRFPLNSSHNAIWDSNIDAEGKLYFALASEICTSEYVHLCSYNYESNTVTDHFSVRDLILPSDRTIRASKFHTSICFMPDGTAVMTTHTTDKAPAHPTWLPEAFYHHLWEGYPGSHIVTFNPKTGEAKNHGIPVPRESIYGSVYDPAHNCLYFMGMFKGHLYRYSFDDRLVYDYGQVSECRAFRLSIGPDGHIYSASKSGWVFKVDTDTNAVIDLNFQYKHKTQEYKSDYTDLSIARVGPDGRLYMAVMYSHSLYALDVKSGRFEDMGRYLETEHYVRGENRCGIFGMDFDSKGVLWYALTARNDGRDGLEYGLPSSLFRWDVARGGRPQWAGNIGTAERVGSWMSEVCITRGDILYAVGSNHGKDGPDITAVDLKLFEPAMGNLGGRTLDPYYDPENEHYRQVARELKTEDDVMAANPFSVGYTMPKPPVALWRALAPDHIAASKVFRLEWETDSRLVGYCAGRETVRVANTYRPGDERADMDRETWRKFIIEDGGLVSICAVDVDAPADVDMPADAGTAPDGQTSNCGLPDNLPLNINRLANLPLNSNQFDNLPLNNSQFDNLPFYPGRQYLAKATAAVKLADGRVVVGTADGMLAVISAGSAGGVLIGNPDGGQGGGCGSGNADVAGAAAGSCGYPCGGQGGVFSLGPAVFNGPIRALAAAPGGAVYGVGGDIDDLGVVFRYDDAGGLRWLGHIIYDDDRNGRHLTLCCPVLTCCAVSPDGKKLAIGSGDRLGMVVIYDI